ncbi:MAG: aminoglycoside phosphotransferase family protein [Fimbriimonadaceae bacterium]|nr:aminoglycoside phosphotransferase family protein [Fimbriimonadaceae bacterium]
MDAAEFRAFRLPAETVARCCARHGLAPPRQVERIRKGEVSASFSLDLADGSSAVLKVYCRSQDPSWLQREAASQQYLRRYSEVPGPSWSILDISGRDVPFPCYLMQRLDGTDGDEVAATADRTNLLLLLRRCGETLSRLHHTPLSDIGEAVAQGLYPAELWAERTAAQFETAIDSLRAQGWCDPALLDSSLASFEAGRAALTAPYEPVFCHRDYQLWNLRVDPATLAIRGVLDFDAAGLGPAESDVRDLELNLFLEQPRLRQEFWRGYGRPRPDGVAAERLRLSCLVRALSLLAAYWGPTARVTPASVWLLLSPWISDADELLGEG